MTQDGKFRVGIIGCGGIAWHHMDSYRRQKDVDLCAFCDIIPGKAERFARKNGFADARCYTDIKDMFANEELDAVSVCTYNTTHKECTVYALEHGAHVLLEKPMCVTLDEGIEMMKAEKKTGKLLSIGFQPRFAPLEIMLHDVVQSGTIGDVYYVQTGGGRRHGIPGSTFIEKKTAGIGAVGDIGCYALDLVLYSLGYPKPLTVSAFTSDFFGKSREFYPDGADRFNVDDFAAAFIRFEGGLVIDFRIAWAMHLDTPGDTILLGKKGGIRVPSTECWNYGPGGRMTIYHDLDGREVETVLPDADFDRSELFDLKIRSFLDAARDGKKAPVPTDEIIINQAILDGIVRSAELGREIEISIPEI